MNIDRASLRTILAELSSAGTRKFKVAKELIALSEARPDALFPLFDDFCALLETRNNIIKWSAFRIVANLASAVPADRIAGILDRYLVPIDGPAMITAANAIAGGAKIAATHARFTARVVRAILRAERARYQTDECRNIAIGHAIDALGGMGGRVRRSGDVIAFVKRHSGNSRAGTRTRAERFLKGMGRGACRTTTLREQNPRSARRRAGASCRKGNKDR